MILSPRNLSELEFYMSAWQSGTVGYSRSGFN
ncbi:hypothetical protein BCEP4_2000006 [Burkholderia cepacia]|nr:hypothetical protein BCEP4_2000006 [Burkholderia cepacia]